MLNIINLLETAVKSGASDLHLTVAIPPVLRINGKLDRMEENALNPDELSSLAGQLLTDEQKKRLNEKGELDFSYSQPGLGRFRVNIYKQRGNYGVAVRIVNLVIPSMEELGLPETLKDLSMKRHGLILVTGPTGSGKSTTLASMIDYINKTKDCHVLTLEDPIEYLHKHQKSVINQREMGSDSESFASALRAALRQDPDVILVGEMRDLETISTAITAAETGHLVMSTLHTVGAANTLDRITDVFPAHQQQQIKVQLANVLEGVISQQLIMNATNTGRVVALEIMIATVAIRNLIREGKTHQIPSAVQTGIKFGMKSMDGSLADLYIRKLITKEAAYSYALDKDFIQRTIG